MICSRCGDLIVEDRFFGLDREMALFKMWACSRHSERAALSHTTRTDSFPSKC